MGKLDSELERLLRFDISVIDQIVRGIEIHRKANYLVRTPNYLEPSISMEKDLPINHVKGQAAYYIKLKKALRIGLRRGKIPAEKYSYLLRGAPEDVRDLLDSK